MTTAAFTDLCAFQSLGGDKRSPSAVKERLAFSQPSAVISLYATLAEDCVLLPRLLSP